MVSDVPVDNEASMVTLGISRFVGLILRMFSYRGKVYVCVFIVVSVLWASALYYIILRKKTKNIVTTQRYTLKVVRDILIMLDTR